jgi:putative transposase
MANGRLNLHVAVVFAQGEGKRRSSACGLRQAFLQPDIAAARQTFRHVADQFRSRLSKLAAFMDESGHDVLAYMDLPVQHRTRCIR